MEPKSGASAAGASEKKLTSQSRGGKQKGGQIDKAEQSLKQISDDAERANLSENFGRGKEDEGSKKKAPTISG